MTVQLDDWLHSLLLAALKQARTDADKGMPGILSPVLGSADESSRTFVFEILEDLVEKRLIDFVYLTGLEDQKNLVFAIHMPRAADVEQRIKTMIAAGGDVSTVVPNEHRGWRIYGPFAFCNDATVYIQGDYDPAKVMQLLDGITPGNLGNKSRVPAFLYELAFSKLNYSFNPADLATFETLPSLVEESFKSGDRMQLTITPEAGQLSAKMTFEEGFLRLVGNMCHLVITMMYGNSATPELPNTYK
jgi:hypothetical protein